MGQLERELTVTRGTYVHRGETVPDTWRDPSECEPDAEFRIEAVVDHTHARGFFPWQSRWWREGEFLIPLTADLDDPTWGLVMVELFAHLAHDEDDTAGKVLRRALASPAPWALYPGIGFAGSDGTRIAAGCCASLRDWTALQRVIEGEEIRLGHEPNVDLVPRGGRLVVRSAMPVEPGSDLLVSEPLYLATTRERFEDAVEDFASEQQRVAARVESWSSSLTGDAQLATDLAARFRSDFCI